jgi:hypothetical protein
MRSPELSVEQCRTLARIRALRPGAEVRLHPTRNGLVVEVRRGRQIQLVRLDDSGAIRRDRRLRLAS